MDTESENVGYSGRASSTNKNFLYKPKILPINKRASVKLYHHQGMDISKKFKDACKKANYNGNQESSETLMPIMHPQSPNKMQKSDISRNMYNIHRKSIGQA